MSSCRGSGTDTLPSDGPEDPLREAVMSVAAAAFGACSNVTADEILAVVVPRVRAEERAATLRAVRERMDLIALLTDKGESWESIYKQLRHELNGDAVLGGLSMSEDTTLCELDARGIEAAAKALAVQAGVPHKDGEPFVAAYDQPYYSAHAEVAVTAYLAAASQEREPEWEYRACADDVLDAEEPEDSELAESLENARALLAAFDSEPPYGHVWIERRVKAGEWQRVDDEQPDPQED